MGGKKKALLEGSIGSGRIAGSLGKRDNIEVIFFDKKSNKMVWLGRKIDSNVF